VWARFPAAPDNPTPGVLYDHALSFFDAMRCDAMRCDAMRAEAPARDFAIEDRLDAQGVMWVIASKGPRGPYAFTDEEWEEFETFAAVPEALKKERREARKASPAPPKSTRPARPLCPQCGHDDEVDWVQRADGEWEDQCLVGPDHPASIPCRT
jgi:hypothetical protein